MTSYNEYSMAYQLHQRKRTLLIALGFTLLSLGQGATATDDQQAREIVDRVDRLLRGESSIRELTFSEYARMGGRLIPARLVMQPMDKPGERTIILYNDLRFDVPIRADTFSLRNLER